MRLFIEHGYNHIDYFKPPNKISNIGILLEGLPSRLNHRFQDPVTGEPRIGNIEHIYNNLPIFGIRPYFEGSITVQEDDLLISGQKDKSPLIKITSSEILTRNGLPIIWKLHTPEAQIRRLIVDTNPPSYEENLATIIEKGQPIPGSF